MAAQRSVNSSRLAALPLHQRAWLGALAGGLAGGITSAVLHPIDTIKTKLQHHGAADLYTGPVVGQHGLLGLYPGLRATVAGSIPSSALYFGSYEFGKGLLGKHLPPRLKGAVPPLAAALGNVISSSILVPKEVIKQRMQVAGTHNAVAVLSATIRSEGVRGLYAGWGAALMRNLPSNVINFTVFEYLKALVIARSDDGSSTLKPWQSFALGAVSGGTSALATTPLDVVKTRLMTQMSPAVIQAAGGSKSAAVAAAMFSSGYSGIASTLGRIAREEGVAGLTRGMAPRLVYSAAFGAIGFFTFESLKTALLWQAVHQASQSASLSTSQHNVGTLAAATHEAAAAEEEKLRVR
eukprot:jgi/Chlat1/9095/Chrsp97S08414